VTGTHIRPIPGREEDYGEAYEELRSIVADHLTIQPPDATDDADEE
jgi:hypothetical protein